MMLILLQIVLGIMYANVLEWMIHKYILHDLGKKWKNSIFRFHWSEHHKVARKNKMVDESYNISWWKEMGRAKEVLGLGLLALIHVPLLLITPWFAATTMLYTVAYYFAHKRSHLDKEWGRKWLPWHFKHHMMGSQEHSFGVLLPITDVIKDAVERNYRTYKAKRV